MEEKEKAHAKIVLGVGSIFVTFQNTYETKHSTITFKYPLKIQFLNQLWYISHNAVSESWHQRVSGKSFWSYLEIDSLEIYIHTTIESSSVCAHSVGCQRFLLSFLHFGTSILKQGWRYSRDLRCPKDYKGILNILSNSHELTPAPMSSWIQKNKKESKDSKRFRKIPKDS